MRTAVALGWIGLALYGGWLGTDITLTPDSPLYKAGAALFALLLVLTVWALVRERSS
ncbi:hypothetical protein GBSOP10_10054 [Armatimonadetes bacterium GBS]|jgi:hypothetical protein|nr:hypothetical protein HRbin14_00942 [bacterium HR14]CUU01045.1 hypothetical protein GBSOP10_10054 [Armatimonadetes bacterium GBS]CUU34310.1 hypothetical protein GXSOP10_11428 [Armatimonadetes bacterium GXS]